MTAYSFGNRWVGVVALGTPPPPPEPLHKMALRFARSCCRAPCGSTKPSPFPSIRSCSLWHAYGSDDGLRPGCAFERMPRPGTQVPRRTHPSTATLAEKRTARGACTAPIDAAAGGEDTGSSRARAAAPSVPTEPLTATGWAQSYPPQAPFSPVGTADTTPPAAARAAEDGPGLGRERAAVGAVGVPAQQLPLRIGARQPSQRAGAGSARHARSRLDAPGDARPSSCPAR